MHVALVALAVSFELLGILWTGRAIAVNNQATGLVPVWREDLRRFTSKFRKPKGQTIVVGTAALRGIGGEAYVTIQKGPLGDSVEDRLARLEANLELAREGLAKEWAERSNQDRLIRREIIEATSEIRREANQKEREASRAERHALDLELWGLIFIAIGVIFGVFATLMT